MIKKKSFEKINPKLEIESKFWDLLKVWKLVRDGNNILT